MARKESSGKQPIFDESEPVRAGVGRTARTVNKLVRDWLLESQERPLRFLTAGQRKTVYYGGGSLLDCGNESRGGTSETLTLY